MGRSPRPFRPPTTLLSRQVVNGESAPRNLRWRCRRGMRELDALLGGWLDHRYGSADARMRAAFEALLGEEDDQLWDWLLGRSRPQREDLQAIVDDIRDSTSGD